MFLNGHYEWLILLVGGMRIVSNNPSSPLYICMFLYVLLCNKINGQYNAIKNTTLGHLKT